jgi:hypothetical protein
VGREVLGVQWFAGVTRSEPDARLGERSQPDGLGSPGAEARRTLEQDAAEGTPVLLGAEALEAVSAE